MKIRREKVQKEILRSKLRYADAVGKGWFGWLIEGHYEGRQVMAQILKEEAAPPDRDRFLQDCFRLQRLGHHANVVGLIGLSLDAMPYLSVLEFQGLGDLKTFLQKSGGKNKMFY